jgi:hypothetical protein
MEMYANFGVPGLYAIGPVAGALVMLLTRWIAAVRIPFLSVPLRALFMIVCVRLALTDFTLFLLDLSLVIAVFLMLVVSVGASTMAVAVGAASKSEKAPIR